MNFMAAVAWNFLHKAVLMLLQTERSFAQVKDFQMVAGAGVTGNLLIDDGQGAQKPAGCWRVIFHGWSPGNHGFFYREIIPLKMVELFSLVNYSHLPRCLMNFFSEGIVSAQILSPLSP